MTWCLWIFCSALIPCGIKKTFLDLYENGVNSSLLNLIYELSRSATISIKTPVGVSETAEVEDIIMQEETLSGILCTSTIDKIGQESPVETIKYKNEIFIPTLGFLDDILNINKCGRETKNMHEYTIEEINKRKLQLNVSKYKYKYKIKRQMNVKVYK